ncbi:MAG: aspartyl-trna synthetase [Rhodobacterales bacterium]|nr:MAG: aspartyl-trna synthetase [Rhodobacterales bacterium]
MNRSRTIALVAALLAIAVGILFASVTARAPVALAGNGLQTTAGNGPLTTPAETAAPAPPAPRETARGPVTGLPLPRFVTLRSSKANVRRGPSLTHRIDWVFTARGMPLEVVGEYGHWRRVRDHDGVGGWVHYRMLSGARAGLVKPGGAVLFARADTASQVNAELDPGVIATLTRCGPSWCQAKAGGYRGWLLKSHLWGVGPAEIFE